MSQPHPPRLWLVLLGLGATVHVAGIIGAINDRPRTGTYGGTHGSETGVITGACIAWGGFLLLLAGLIMWAVDYVLQRRDTIAALAANPDLARSGRPSSRSALQPANDPEPFAAHDGDTAIVSDVRRALSLGSARSSVRGQVRKASRETGVSHEDLALIEALMVEAERRPKVSSG